MERSTSTGLSLLASVQTFRTSSMTRASPCINRAFPDVTCACMASSLSNVAVERSRKVTVAPASAKHKSDRLVQKWDGEGGDVDWRLPRNLRAAK